MTTATQPEVGTTVARVEQPLALTEHRGHVEVNFGELMALAKELVPTGLLPKHIRTAGQAAAIILTGREMGMGPMRALRSLQMVEGKVVESADSQLARFKSDGGRAVFQVLTEKEAVLVLRHPNGDEHTERFAIEDAGRVGLLGKDNWKKYPKAMLRSRVITAGLKSVGWEGGAGNYDPEEASGFAPHIIVPEPVHATAVVVDADGVVVTDEPFVDTTEQLRREEEARRAGKENGRTSTSSSPSAPPISPTTSAMNGASTGMTTANATDEQPQRPGPYPPTEKQVAFYQRLADSPVFSAAERDHFADWLETMATRQTIKDKIDYLKREVEARKARTVTA